MHFTLPAIALPIAMLLSAIALACWLASKQSKIVDAIVFLVGLFIVVWLLFSVHVI